MAVRDGEAFLGAQLASIAGQEGVDWRILAGEDGSLDGSRAVLEGFARDFPGQLRIVAGPGRGATANFLRLLAMTGPEDGHLAFSDQDDVWFPDKLSRAVRAMAEGTGPQLWCSRTQLCDEGLRDLGPSQTMPADPGFDLVLVEALASGNSMVMNPEAAALLRRAAGMTPAGVLEGVYHDWWATQVVAGAGGRLIWDPRPSLSYRQHGAALLGHGGGWRRVRRAGDGAYLASLRLQLRAISAVQGLFSPESVALFRRLEGVLAGQSRLDALRLPLRRRTPLATLALRLMLLFGRA
jgi:glycosyltransferase involved in cell wall biosynthesis